MTQEHVLVVIGAERVRGTIETSSWPLDGSKSEVLVQLDDGRQMLVPFKALSRHKNGSYVVNMDADDSRHQQAANNSDGGQSVVIPVMIEELNVQKRTVETGRLRITKVVHEHEELVDEPSFREEVTIERVPINRYVEEPIPVRYEGDTMIVSLLEEVPVIERRLMLKEEVRITKRSVEGHQPRPVTLRSEEVTVEHVEPHNVNEKDSLI